MATKAKQRKRLGGPSVDGGTQPKGFGVPMKDAKTDLIKRKRPDLFGDDNADHAPTGHGFYGSDNAEEGNTVAPGSESTGSTQNSPSVTVDQSTGLLQVSQSELQKLIDQAANKRALELNQSLQAQQEALQAEADKQAQQNADQLAKLQDEVAKSQAEAARLKAVFDATGNSIPAGEEQQRRGDGRYSFAVNTLILPSSMEPQGAAKDFMDILGNKQYTPRVVAYDSADGEEYQQIDTTYLDRWLRDPHNRKHAIADMERLFKAHGLLRGADMGRDNPGPTLGVNGSIKEAFLPFLSGLMRTSHVARYVWWQFATTRLELGRVAGNNILVPRFQWLAEPEDPNDYRLDTAESAASISRDSQGMEMLTTAIELFGYGLGKGNRVSNRPIAIPEFIMASSMVDLLQALEQRLGQNYNGFEDLSIRRVYQQTLDNPNNVYFNNGGSLTNTPGDVAVGEDGTMTEDVLNSLFGEMTRRQIPTYDNGTRVGVLNTFATTQVKNSLGDKLRAQSEAEIQEVTNILNAGNLGDGIIRPSGYIGTYCNFMLFESGTIATGMAGTEGVYDTAFGAGNRTARDNFFFGPGVCGKGESLPMEVRGDDAGTFGTKMRFIWRSIEGWGSLDCTSTNQGQQDRCLVLRTADQAI